MSQVDLNEQEQLLSSIYYGVNYPIFVIDVFSSDQFAYVDWNLTAEEIDYTTTCHQNQISQKSLYGMCSRGIESKDLQSCVEQGIPVTRCSSF